MSEILIATLGTESQVVTLSLLELERMRFEVGEVILQIYRSKVKSSVLVSIIRSKYGYIRRI